MVLISGNYTIGFWMMSLSYVMMVSLVPTTRGFWPCRIGTGNLFAPHALLVIALSSLAGSVDVLTFSHVISLFILNGQSDIVGILSAMLFVVLVPGQFCCAYLMIFASLLNMLAVIFWCGLLARDICIFYYTYIHIYA